MNSRQIALLWAILYLRDHNLRSDPEILLAFVDHWIQSCQKMNQEIAVQCGIHAAKECGFPCHSPEVELIEPEDLRD